MRKEGLIYKLGLTMVLLLCAGSIFAQVGVEAGYGLAPLSACKGKMRQIVTAEVSWARASHPEAHFFEYTLTLGYDWGTPPKDFNGIPSQVKSDVAGDILLGARYIWSAKAVSLYSGLGLGTEVRCQKGERGKLYTPSVSYQITAIGMQAAYRHVMFRGELGVGNLGILRVGVGYKF